MGQPERKRHARPSQFGKSSSKQQVLHITPTIIIIILTIIIVIIIILKPHAMPGNFVALVKKKNKYDYKQLAV